MTYLLEWEHFGSGLYWSSSYEGVRFMLDKASDGTIRLTCHPEGFMGKTVPVGCYGSVEEAKSAAEDYLETF